MSDFENGGLVITKERQEDIIKEWNSRPHSPPSLKELVQIAFPNISEKLQDGRSKYGKCLKAFLVSRNIKAKASHEYVGRNDVSLTDEMKDMVDAMIEKNMDLLKFLSPENWIQSIKDHVFIMHGANDSMVPFTESSFLDENLKNSTLLISFLYEHREISTNRNIFFKLKEFLKLIQFNAKYIRYNL